MWGSTTCATPSQPWHWRTVWMWKPSPPCWAMCRRPPHWTSIPTSPTICGSQPPPTSTAASARQHRRRDFQSRGRKLPRPRRKSRVWPISSPMWAASAGLAPAASVRLTTISLKAVIPLNGPTAKSTPAMFTPTPARSARKSWRY